MSRMIAVKQKVFQARWTKEPSYIAIKNKGAFEESEDYSKTPFKHHILR